MINKVIVSLAAAVSDIKDGAVVLCAGFGAVGAPDELIDALVEQGARELTIVSNNAGNGRTGLGTISERMRCAAAGLGGFYSPVGVGTKLAEGKETREIDGRLHVFEKPLKGDIALLKADRADRWGNLTYRKSARNFNPTMAMAASLSIVQVREIVPLGTIDPENVVTPGIFVDRVVELGGKR